MKQKFNKLLCLFRNSDIISHKNLVHLCKKEESLVIDALKEGLIAIYDVNDIGENRYYITNFGKNVRDS